MDTEKPRSLLLPLLLIILGLALLARRFGLVAWTWVEIMRFWPALLILAGLDLLLGRSRAGGIVMVILGIAAFVAFARFVELGATGRESLDDTFSYDVRGVELATVHLDAGVGRLDLSATNDPDALIVADVVWDARIEKPVFATDRSNGNASVRLRTPRSSWVTIPGRWDQRWHVSLAPQVPMRLRVNGGVNQVYLDLRDLTIDDVDIDLGIGEATILLAEGAYRVTVDGGIGSLTIEIPDDVQARMRLSGGLGSMNVSARFQRDGAYYVTEDWDPHKATVEVDVDGGIGAIHVR